MRTHFVNHTSLEQVAAELGSATASAAAGLGPAEATTQIQEAAVENLMGLWADVPPPWVKDDVTSRLRAETEQAPTPPKSDLLLAAFVAVEGGRNEQQTEKRVRRVA